MIFTFILQVTQYTMNVGHPFMPNLSIFNREHFKNDQPCIKIVLWYKKRISEKFKPGYPAASLSKCHVLLIGYSMDHQT